MTRAPVVFLLFFVSGFSALVYQVVWLRMAFASFGVITPVLSVVISVFMLGLALGSWLGGRSIGAFTRRTGRSAIYAYGAVEFGIGLGAFLVPVLFRWGEVLLRPAGEIDSAAYLSVSALAMTAAILPWCVLMGTTFPVMAAYLREEGSGHETSFSYLYLANVVGAMCGVGMTAVVLIETWGFSRTLLLAGLLNFSIAAASVVLGRVTRPGPVRAAPETAATDAPTLSDRPGEGPQPEAGALRPAFAVAVLFGTGFISMAMEVVWTRAYTPILSTTIYAFAGLLAVYLLATWIGTALYRAMLRAGTPLDNGTLLALIALASLLPVLLPDPRVLPSPWVALGSIGPFCVGLGYLTPKLIDEFSRGRPALVGRAYAWNILGSILGPLAAAYMLLPTVGAKWSLVLLALPAFAFLLLALAGSPRRSRVAALGALSLVLLVVVSVRSTTFEDGRFYPNAVVRRDHTATVISADDGTTQVLLVNGIGITYKTPITKMMAHLPMAFHEGEAGNTLVICFGMGTTMRSLASWDVPVTAVELVPSVADAFGYYFDDADEYREDPDVEIVIDDGRRYLKRTSKRFDVVTIDPPPPVETAGSSLLYSYEFYELLKTRMTEGAVLQQWLPWGDDAVVQGTTAAIVKAFPHVRVFRSVEQWGLHFIASDRALPDLTARELFERMPPAARDDLAEWVGPYQVRYVFETTVNQEVPIDELLPDGVTRWISDDRPLNEYFLLRRYVFGSGDDGRPPPAP